MNNLEDKILATQLSASRRNAPVKRKKGELVLVQPDKAISREWASQFASRQYYKRKYALSEKQLRQHISSRGLDWAPNTISTLNHRLDTMVYLLGWAPSIKAARRLIRAQNIFTVFSDNKELLAHPDSRFDIIKPLSSPAKIITPGQTLYLDVPVTYSIDKPRQSAASFFIETLDLNYRHMGGADRLAYLATLIHPLFEKPALGEKFASEKFELQCVNIKKRS